MNGFKESYKNPYSQLAVLLAMFLGGGDGEKLQLNVLLDVDGFSRPFQSTIIRPAAKNMCISHYMSTAEYQTVSILYC